MPPAARKPATTRRRTTTTAAKRRPAAPPAPTPAVVLTSDDSDTEEATFPLFEINGTVYTMPARPHAGLALQLLTDFEAHGEGIAGMKLVRTLIGDEAYKALSQFKGLRPADVAKITEAAMNLTLGALEEDNPAGN